MTFSQHQKIYVERCKDLDKQYRAGKITRGILKLEITFATCYFNQAIEYSRKGK